MSLFIKIFAAFLVLIIAIYFFASFSLPSSDSDVELSERFQNEYGACPFPGEKVNLPNKIWKEKLTPEQFAVLRENGTERAFTGALTDNKREGTYLCAACGLPVFSSKEKYDSKTGWPSFWLPFNSCYVGYSIDTSFFIDQVEVHCNRCGSHLGHVFNDGPPPTNHRYCINSVALKFVTKEFSQMDIPEFK